MAPAVASVRAQHRSRLRQGAVLEKSSSRSEVAPAAASVRVQHRSRLRQGAVLEKSSSRSEMAPAAASVRVQHRSRLRQGAVLEKSSSRSEMAPAAASVRVQHRSRLPQCTSMYDDCMFEEGPTPWWSLVGQREKNSHVPQAPVEPLKLTGSLHALEHVPDVEAQSSLLNPIRSQC